jgi:hypothetical protein
MDEFNNCATTSYHKAGLRCGDWVLLRGVRTTYPYCTFYHASQLVYADALSLAPQSFGEINRHETTFFKEL